MGRKLISRIYGFNHVHDRIGKSVTELESGLKKKCGFGDQIHWFLEVDRRQIRLISLSDFKKYFGSGQTRPKNNLMYLIM